MKTFNSAPYYDDFAEDSKFHRILFRPGYAVQARELTQIQTIIQNQIKRHGDHIFREGAMVIPGQMSIDTTVSHVKLQATDLDVTDFIGRSIVGESGIQAHVVHAIAAEGTDPATLYVHYITSGDDNTTQVFAVNETVSSGILSLQVAVENATGVGSIATVQRGVYYIGGNFVICPEQTIVLDKYTNEPSYRIGLIVDEQIVTPEDDDNLLDNAQGSYNYAAPGAHRYYVDLILTKLAISSEQDTNFVELLRVNNGNILHQTNTTKYAEIEKTLARRTFDESGNYTVRNFTIDVREHRNNDRGQWATNVQYIIGDIVRSGDNTYVAKRNGQSGTIAPTHAYGTSYDGAGNTGVQWEYNAAPVYNRGIYTPETGGDENKIAVGLEPGKAYIQGYEIEKVAVEYVPVNKSRDSVQVDNAIIPATVGNYVLITNINNAPPVHTYATINLYNRLTSSLGAQPGGTLVGTARVRFIEWDNGTIGTQAAVYKLGLFDIQMVAGYDFNRDVKSFFSNVSSDVNLSFSADIRPETFRLIGSASGTGTTTITGNGTSFQTTLKVNDFISLGGTIRRVVSIASQTSFTVDQNTTVTNVTIDRLSTRVVEPENNSLLFRLPYYAIKSARGSTNTNDITYTVYERYTASAGADLGSTCVLTIAVNNGTFASAAETDNYILIDNDVTAGGAIVAPISTVVTNGGLNVEFTLADTYSGRQFTVIATVNKSGSTLTEKTKTLRLAGDVGTVIEKTTAATAQLKEIALGKADCYRLISVMMKPGTFGSPGADYTIDISDRYDFDSGQRDTHYDIGRLILKSSYTPPTAPIQITFEYFDHSGGDYFTVNSYGDYSTNTSNTSNIAYPSIPVYLGTHLSDFIDFRPRMADDGSGFVGGVTSLMPKRGIDIRADYQYHLARKTKIAVDFNGQFFALDGVSSLNPGEPSDPSLGMVLYTLTLEPYTYGVSSRSVDVQAHDNKRYTMRDIGKLEKRIDNLEYYTTLSLLEQQTESLDIIDSSGETRFKNGFIVDGFTGHNTGDTSSADYLCSIDMENAELRPFFSMRNINVVEKNTTTAQRATANYKLYGDVITLPVVEDVALVKQDYASRLENINPFAIFTFLGSVTITPSSDDWFEVDRRPDIVNDVEGSFTTIRMLAERAGVLGTVWNAWQNQWVGSTVAVTNQFSGRFGAAWGAGLNFGNIISAAEMNNWFGNVRGAGWARREVFVQTTATTIGQTRTGTRTTLVAKIDRQIVADRVLSTAVIPYIRSRNILVQVKGLKPNTQFYPFFDNNNVSNFITTASRLVYTPGSRVFDTTTNVGGLAVEAARRIKNDTQVCLNRGDVVTGSTSGATAVVVGTEFNADTNTYALFVMNVFGTFTANETITGNISTATGRFVSLAAGSTGGAVVSNFNGDVNLIFNIPNTESIRFRCGAREFKLVDNVQADGAFTSRGRGQYYAQGILETRQQTVNAVRNAELVQEQVRDNRVIVDTSTRVVADTGWYDPLAQTFLVQQKGGAFLSKIDIFFASKDPKIPVNIEIREVINGYPGKLVLPFSRVSLKPEQVVLSNNTVDLDGETVPKYDTPTSFVFPSPVYVQDNGEYAIVLSSDSNNYRVWISQLGDRIPGSTRSISEQPYAGVFFKSQNASTWTADQMQDLKFTIYRAKFDTTVIGNVEFVNDIIPFQDLDFDPIETKTGVAKIRVYQQSHGMPVGSRVIIDNLDEEIVNGVVGTGVITTTAGSTAVVGSGTAFTTQLTVGSVIYSSTGAYVGVIGAVTSNTAADLVNNAAAAITAGSFKYTTPVHGIPTTEIYKTHLDITDVDIDSYCVAVATAPTSSGYAGGLTVRATRNIQYDTIQPIVQMQTFSDTMTEFGIKATSGKTVDSAQTPYTLSSDFVPIMANEPNTLYAPLMVASGVNETTSLGGAKSLTMNVMMTTANDSLSPIIDTHRTSIIAISNKVNSPTETNTNVGGLDDNVVISNSSVVSIVGSTITTADPTAAAALRTIKVGKHVTIAGASSGSSTRLVTAVAVDGTTVTFAAAPDACTGNITVTQREVFVDEIAPSGSSTYSKYVTKSVSLATPSTFARIRFAANIPDGAVVEVYYRTSPVGASTPIEDLNYTRVQSDEVVINVQNGSNQFIDMTHSTGDIPAFDMIQVKLVLKSINSSAVPRLKDLRVIACA